MHKIGHVLITTIGKGVTLRYVDDKPRKAMWNCEWVELLETIRPLPEMGLLDSYIYHKDTNDVLLKLNRLL